ncbi:MAG TPA: hypothetical protein VGK18_13045 [Propionicimonas sp.]|uniref:flavodoxin family protein n=1 Tax=Propionicimonas sp. TaxID=1955623 RepID=UPI002F40C07D
MKAVVVYESLWGNTAAVAEAIADGLGDGAQALSTAQAVPEVVADADLVVAGGPVFAFHLSTDHARGSIRRHPEPGAPEADWSHPSMRSWMEALPAASGRCAAFDTRVLGPFGKGAPTVADELQAKGYQLVAPPEGFIVTGKFGPLRHGELERARRWGEQLLQRADLVEGSLHDPLVVDGDVAPSTR